MKFEGTPLKQWGKGTNRAINEMRQSNLPEPEFQNLSGGFEVILIGPGKSFEKEIERGKMHRLDINIRQKKAIKYVKNQGSIARNEYMKINNISHKTAHLELKELVEKKIFIQDGKGRASKYLFKR